MLKHAPNGPPAISVLIPSYSYSRFLPEAIESVLAQDFDDFELLISDDASQDDSAEVIASYAERDRRIRAHIHPANQGMVRNWNWCLENARGEYVHYLFADDKFASPHALRSMYEAMRAHPSAVLAASPRLIINEHSNVVKVMARLDHGLHKGAQVIARCVRDYGNLIGEPSVVMFRRESARRGFDESYLQLVDLEMWLNLLQRGDLIYLEKPLACFRKHSSQQSAVNRKRRINCPERARLFWSCERRGLLPASQRRLLLFRNLYELKKTNRLCNGTVSNEHELLKELGLTWYSCLWTAHKLLRPIKQLRGWYEHRRNLNELVYNQTPLRS